LFQGIRYQGFFRSLLGFTGPEVREGLASHLEKRKPAFPAESAL